MMTGSVSDAIDFVYTWVDGEKNAALRERYAATHIQEKAVIDSTVHYRRDDLSGHNRFRDNQEILQSIASVRRFAPFVRKIFIVAAEGQIPDWYIPADYPEVEMVSHPRLFGAQFADFLPTFNSHTIEAMLPFISDLSERFVYFNDDMFLGATLTPEDLFDPDGKAVVRVCHRVEALWQAHKKAWRVYRGNMYAALQAQFPGTRVYDTAHQARTLLKSSCLRTWNDPNFKELLIHTARDRFRDLSNIPPIELFSNMMLIENKGRIAADHGVVLRLFDRTVFGPEFCALKNIQPKFYCINDDMRAPTEHHLAKFSQCLSQDLPHHLNVDTVTGRRIHPRRPALGAVQRNVAHVLSWCNRMLGNATAIFSRK